MYDVIDKIQDTIKAHHDKYHKATSLSLEDSDILKKRTSKMATVLTDEELIDEREYLYIVKKPICEMIEKSIEQIVTLENTIKKLKKIDCILEQKLTKVETHIIKRDL